MENESSSTENQTTDSNVGNDIQEGGTQDGVQSTVQEENNEAQETQAQEVSSERPEWLLEKFGSNIDEAIQMQAKSYTELQKKMGENWGAPKEGYSLPENSNVTLDDPLLKNMEPVLKELGLSDKGLSKLLDGYDNAIMKIIDHKQQEVKKQLTETQAATVRDVDKWIDSRFDKDKAATLRNMIDSVESFELLNEIRLSMPPPSRVPSGSEVGGARYESVHDIEREAVDNKSRYDSDSRYRAEIAQRVRDAKQRESYR